MAEAGEEELDPVLDYIRARTPAELSADPFERDLIADVKDGI